MNILIVDDHPNLARVTAMALRALGWGTFTADTTAAATHLLDTHTIHDIFLDVNLGAEFGLDLLSQVVAQADGPPVIMFTAHAKDEIAHEVLQRGALGFLVKPFDLDDLRQQINLIEYHPRNRSTVSVQL